MNLKIRALLTTGLALATTAFASTAVAGPSEDAIKALQDGNARFVAGTSEHPNTGLDRVSQTASGQNPFVTILGCSDSRVPIERVFDQGIGDVFVIRVAGNVSDTDEIGSVEYGVGHLGTPLLVVLGHTKCGAVTAVAMGEQVHGSIPGLVDNIIPAVEAAKQKHPDLSGKALVPFAIEENIWQSIADQFAHSQEVRTLVQEGKLEVVGALYDIDTGKVKWLGEHPKQSALLAAPMAHTTRSAEHGDSHGAGHAPAKAASSHAVSGDAAAASRVASTGSYIPPQSRHSQRAAFGSDTGTAKDYAPIADTIIDSGLLVKIFFGVAGMSLLATIGIGYWLSRTTKADGSPTRALTLGTKLAGGFGAVVTGILVLTALSGRASVLTKNAAFQAEHVAEQDVLIANMKADMLDTQMAFKDFLLTNSDEDLAHYSDAAATFAHKHDLAGLTIKDFERAEMVELIGTHFDEYEHKVAEVVSLVDERNAIIWDLMDPAAARITTLIEEIDHTAHADGHLEASILAAETDAKFQQARLAFFKFLRSGSEEHAKESIRFAEETQHELNALLPMMNNPIREAWAKETVYAINFWVAQMEHAEELQVARNELVNTELTKLGAQIAAEATDLEETLNLFKKDEMHRAESIARGAKVQTTLFSIGVALIGTVIAFFIARGIIRDLKTLENRLKDISQGEGDLTKRVDIKSRDEIGMVAQWFNVFVDKIEKVVSDVKLGALQIDSGGTQIASASQSLAEGASEQASSLQQISASIEEMSGQTQQSAENARQANTLAEESKNSADRGQQEMAKMTEAVNEIKQSSAEISNIIKVIDEIAFQTNLLALNAAVEAARAGEAGKGFAVVAEEVRNLAQRSAEAAKNTATMIEDSVKRSENGVEIAGRVGQALQEITTSTNKVNTLLSEIASAASEQATGIGQVNQGVSQLDQVTQQNAGNSEEMASSAEELASQVAGLNDLVNQFKVGNGGNQAPAAGKAGPALASHSSSNTFTKSAPAATDAPTSGGDMSPEQLIPMDDDDEVLASF